MLTDGTVTFAALSPIDASDSLIQLAWKGIEASHFSVAIWTCELVDGALSQTNWRQTVLGPGTP